MSSLQRHTLSPEQVGLIRADLQKPGYGRCNKDPVTFTSSDSKTLSGAERDRIEGLAIPPAWRDVWISRNDTTHILAFGTDDEGRRQYIYHPDWRAACEHAKFCDLVLFAKRLPRLRRRVRLELQKDPTTAEYAISAIVRLMDRAGLRIGNWKSPNDGAVTLTEEHIEIHGHELNLEYTAKGGKARSIELEDPFLVEAIEALNAQPGSELFANTTSKTEPRHVNAFIRDTMGHAFSAKDFRTWGGSVRAARVLFEADDRVTIKAVSQAAADWFNAD